MRSVSLLSAADVAMVFVPCMLCFGFSERAAGFAEGIAVACPVMSIIRVSYNAASVTVGIALVVPNVESLSVLAAYVTLCIAVAVEGVAGGNSGLTAVHTSGVKAIVTIGVNNVTNVGADIAFFIAGAAAVLMRCNAGLAASVTVGIAFVRPNVRSIVSFGAANVTELIASVGVGMLAGLSCFFTNVAKLVAFTGVGVLAIGLSLKVASVTYVIALA